MNKLSYIIAAAFLYFSAAAQDLLKIEREIEQRRVAEQELNAQAQRVEQERKTLNRQIIKLTKKLTDMDQRRSKLKKRLAALKESEMKQKTALHDDRVKLSQSLAALQSMSEHPPPAFAVHPDDALKAVQGRIALASVVPRLQLRAEDLKARLTELTILRARIAEDQDVLAATETEAARHRKTLEKRLMQRAKTEKAIRKKADIEAKEIARLVAEAQNLRQLSRKLTQHRRERNNSLKIENFEQARGTLSLPVRGRIVKGFGEEQKTGDIARGIYIDTPYGAQITAPHDAEILYAGPFRQYGNIVILGLGNDYQMVLTGIANLQSYAGQKILAGEPIGQMQKNIGDVVRKPLYIELRYNNEPIDPVPWMRLTG